MGKRLYRSRGDRMIAGVCGGIAEYFGLDPTLIRVLAVVLLVVGNAAVIVAYLVMAIVVPERPEGEPEEGVTVSDENLTEAGMGPGDIPEPGDEIAVPPPPSAPPGPPATVPPPPDPPSAAPPAQPPHFAEPMTPPPWPEPPRPGRAGITFGVALILLGIAVIAGRFVGSFPIWTMWPLVIVVIGVIQLFTPGREGWGVVRIAEGVGTIVFGLVLFGCTTGMIGWDVWWRFISLWPLLLVALGVSIVGRSLHADWVRAIASLLVTATLVFAAYGAWMRFDLGLWPIRSAGEPFSLSEEEGSIQEATLRLEAGSGDIEIGDGAALVDAEGETAFGEASLAVERTGSSADVLLDAGGSPGPVVPGGPTGSLDLALSRDVLWDADISAGLCTMRADLTDLRVSDLTLSTGMSDVTVSLGDVPPAVEEAVATVKGGFATIRVDLPADAEVRVVSDSGLTASDIDRRLERVGSGQWQTPGYEAARAAGEGVWLVRVQAGFGTVDVSMR